MTAIPSTEINENWSFMLQNKSRRFIAALVAVGVAGVVAAGAWTLGRHNATETPSARAATGKLRAEPQTPARVVNLPHMQLQAQYSGPLLHTIIQRWRDPIDGAICYIYLPIAVHHSQPTTTGYVEYESGSIGSISCLPVLVVRPAPKSAGPTTQQ